MSNENSFMHYRARQWLNPCGDWIRNAAVVSKTLHTSFEITKLVKSFLYNIKIFQWG